jgi:hypothetical protein
MSESLSYINKVLDEENAEKSAHARRGGPEPLRRGLAADGLGGQDLVEAGAADGVGDGRG